MTETTETARKTYDVLVHKAAVPLMKDESIGAFTKALRGAGRDHIMQKFNIQEGKGSVFPIEVFSNKAVFSVVPDFEKPPSNDFHIAVKFVRSTGTGQFNFTDTIKVTPITSFVASGGDVAAKVAKDASEPEPEAAEVVKVMGMDAWTHAPRTFAGVI